MTFFKRYRMHFELRDAFIETPELEPDYQLWPWRDNLLEVHAQAKFESFRSELDAAVFPCLGDRSGCLRLMREITSRAGFVPLATWLIIRQEPQTLEIENCATIQGLCEKEGVGSIQNIGVVPEYRGLGLGTVLLSKALQGFKKAGMRLASLEVTAENDGAVRLYQRFGFKIVNTVYKSIEMPLVS